MLRESNLFGTKEVAKTRASVRGNERFALGATMGIPRFQFRLATLMAIVATAAVVVWGWPIWQRYQAVRQLVSVVHGPARNADKPIREAVEEVHRLDVGATALDSLREALDDSDYQVRFNALMALRRLDVKPEQKIPLFVYALTSGTKETKEEETTIRSSAAGSLGLMGPDANSAIPVLNGALRNDCVRVGKTVIAALTMIDPSAIDPRAEAVHGIRQRLESQYYGGGFVDATLADICEYLSDVGDVKITVDWRSLQKHGIGQATPVTYDPPVEASFGTVFREIIDSINAAYLLRPNGIAVVATDGNP